MRLTSLKTFAAVLFIASAAWAPAALGQAATPRELGDDENVAVTRADDKALPARFNYGRQFLVSVNRAIPGAAALKGEIAAHIARAGALDRVLFESFGTEPPAGVAVKIGKRVPVEIAQAVIRAVAARKDLAVTVYVYKDDTITLGGRRLFFAYTQRVIVGSLGENKGEPLGAGKAEALLREGITQKEFFKLLSGSE